MIIELKKQLMDVAKENKNHMKIAVPEQDRMLKQ
jgi:hypothetical protein